MFTLYCVHNGIFSMFKYSTTSYCVIRQGFSQHLPDISRVPGDATCLLLLRSSSDHIKMISLLPKHLQHSVQVPMLIKKYNEVSILNLLET